MIDFEDLKTDEEKLTRINQRVLEYHEYQNDVEDGDSGTAFDFSNEAANTYIPWLLGQLLIGAAPAGMVRVPARCKKCDVRFQSPVGALVPDRCPFGCGGKLVSQRTAAKGAKRQ